MTTIRAATTDSVAATVTPRTITPTGTARPRRTGRPHLAVVAVVGERLAARCELPYCSCSAKGRSTATS